MNKLDDTALTFGKYKGKTPRQVSKYDPSYVDWMFRTVKPTPCSRALHKTALFYLNEQQAEHDNDLFDSVFDLSEGVRHE